MPTPWDHVSDQAGKDRSTEQGDKSSGGEYGQAGPFAPDTPHQATSEQEVYPSPFGYGYYSNNRMFSSDKSDTPDSMAAETSGSQSDFAELQQFLMNNLETPGSRIAHPTTGQWSPPHPEKKQPGDGKTGL